MRVIVKKGLGDTLTLTLSLSKGERAPLYFFPTQSIGAGLSRIAGSGKL